MDACRCQRQCQCRRASLRLTRLMVADLQWGHDPATHTLASNQVLMQGPPTHDSLTIGIYFIGLGLI